MSAGNDGWKSIHGRAFTSSGRVFPATLARHSDETQGLAAWIEGIPYGPGDLIEGDRVIGFHALDGTPDETVAMFNLQARKER